ncbi:unnamed protein product [Amoebophrya sp. A25]|nr:unnamed protein product [Amoebophrya sp. A25]|eukprot:GSA25T00013746001.1
MMLAFGSSASSSSRKRPSTRSDLKTFDFSHKAGGVLCNLTTTTRTTRLLALSCLAADVSGLSLHNEAHHRRFSQVPLQGSPVAEDDQKSTLNRMKNKAALDAKLHRLLVPSSSKSISYDEHNNEVTVTRTRRTEAEDNPDEEQEQQSAVSSTSLASNREQGQEENIDESSREHVMFKSEVEAQQMIEDANHGLAVNQRSRQETRKTPVNKSKKSTSGSAATSTSKKKHKKVEQNRRFSLGSGASSSANSTLTSKKRMTWGNKCPVEYITKEGCWSYEAWGWTLNYFAGGESHDMSRQCREHCRGLCNQLTAIRFPEWNGTGRAISTADAYDPNNQSYTAKYLAFPWSHETQNAPLATPGFNGTTLNCSSSVDNVTWAENNCSQRQTFPWCKDCGAKLTQNWPRSIGAPPMPLHCTSFAYTYDEIPNQDAGITLSLEGWDTKVWYAHLLHNAGNCHCLLRQGFDYIPVGETGAPCCVREGAPM